MRAARKTTAATTKAFKRFMRVATQPVQVEYDWHVGVLSRQLWEALPGDARRELMLLVTEAVVQVAKKHCAGGSEA